MRQSIIDGPSTAERPRGESPLPKNLWASSQTGHEDPENVGQRNPKLWVPLPHPNVIRLTNLGDVFLKFFWSWSTPTG
ncbi:hypothetical protein JTE90_016199 [Oedothorax gibbosus]|uniref:Uncharacterized protein n=1 Tax=Oedothorax gibbosus TaxID=931172 RepID=A0AAV6TCV5_9ARAC|nr:hypothetical protein JTE90_016199 [Oedothorax gibbosus]